VPDVPAKAPVSAAEQSTASPMTKTPTTDLRRLRIKRATCVTSL
jgi:hypothetical protein